MKTKFGFWLTAAMWSVVAMALVAMAAFHIVASSDVPVSGFNARTTASSDAVNHNASELIAPEACDEYQSNMIVNLRTETPITILLQLAHEGVTQQTAQFAVDGWRDRNDGNKAVVAPQTFVSTAWATRSGFNGLAGSWSVPRLTGRSIDFLRIEDLLRANPRRWSIRRHDVYYVDLPNGTAPPESTQWMTVTRTPAVRATTNPLTPNTTRYTIDVTTSAGVSTTYMPTGDTTDLTQLFTGTPVYTAPGTLVDHSINWKVYANRGQLVIPRRGYERQVRQACAAIPQVAGVINNDSPDQRRRLVRLLSQLDHVDEDVNAPDGLKPVVATARDMITAALERRLPSDQREIDTKKAQARSYRAAYHNALDFIVRAQSTIRNYFTVAAWTTVGFLALALMLTIVVGLRWRKSPPPTPGKTIKVIRLALLREIDADLMQRMHFMKGNVHLVNDEGLRAYIDDLKVIDSVAEQIVDNVAHFFETYGLVLKAVANQPKELWQAPSEGGASGVVTFKDRDGNELPRTNDNIAAALQRAFDAGLANREPVVTNTVEQPVTSETTAAGNTCAIDLSSSACAPTLIKCNNTYELGFKAGAASRDAEVEKLTAAAREAQGPRTEIMQLLVGAKILDAGIAEVPHDLALASIAHQIGTVGRAIASHADEVREIISIRDACIKRAGAAERDLLAIRNLNRNTAQVVNAFENRAVKAEGEVVLLRAFPESVWPEVFGQPLPDNHVPTGREIGEVMRRLRARRAETSPHPAAATTFEALDLSDETPAPDVLMVETPIETAIGDRVQGYWRATANALTQQFEVPQNLRRASNPNLHCTVMVPAAANGGPLPDETATVEQPSATPSIHRKAPTSRVEAVRPRALATPAPDALSMQGAEEPLTPAAVTPPQMRRTPPSQPVPVASGDSAFRGRTPVYVGQPPASPVFTPGMITPFAHIIGLFRSPTPSGVILRTDIDISAEGSEAPDAPADKAG